MSTIVSWHSIEDMFHELHSKEVKYIVLRNFEEIDETNFYTSGHADIDFLTTDGTHFAEIIGAVPRFVKNDGIHYKVDIGGTEVIIDTRAIGDGYYDKAWEKELLAKRELKDSRFFIPDERNYYYSLVYHAILQKKELTAEYLQRLNKMAEDLGMHANDQDTHLLLLDNYMRKNGYYYTLPYDIHVPLRTDLVESKLVKKQMNVFTRDLLINAMTALSKIKHHLIH